MKVNILLLNRLMGVRAMTQTELATHLNVTRQVVNNWFNRGTVPNKKIRGLRALFGDEFEKCLLNVDNERVQLEIEPERVTQTHRHVVENDLKQKINRLEIALSEKGGVPYFNIDFCAGFDLVENSLQNTPDAYISDPLFASAEYVVRCSGDSMGDKIPNGCYLGIKKVELPDILYGEIYAIVTKVWRTVKYVRKSTLVDHLLLVPEDTKNYDPQDYPKEKILSVWAVVAYGLKIN